jgi:hypothetical protein
MMKIHPIALLIALIAGGCWGLGAAATAPAEVLGEPVPNSEPAEVREIIITRLLDHYAAERGIRAEPTEIDALLDKMRRDMAASGLTAADDLTPEEQAPEEQAKLDAMRRDMARALIRQWKVNKALYNQYGGRLIYQQLGPEPLDAYRQFLRQRQAEGAFAIRDQAIEASFWRYFTDESIHDFMAPGGADEARAFTVPPWEQQP